jgi:hypothetical protein
MSKTLETMRTTTRMYLDEVSAADWSDAQIDEQINYKYLEVYTAVVDTYEDYYRTRSRANLEAGSQEYALPDDFYKMRRLEIQYVSGGDFYKATRCEFDQILSRSIQSTQIGSTSRPNYYLSGTFLGLLPVPTEDITNGLVMWYIKQVAELVSNSDLVDIPFVDRYASMIPKAAAGELLSKGQQEEVVAAKYLEEFQRMLEKMQTELEDRKAEGSKNIIDTVGDTMDFSQNYGAVITIAS